MAHDKHGGSDWDDAEDRSQEIEPFWQRLNRFFLFPFQAEPLIYAVGLSLCCFLLIFPSIFVFVVALGLMLAVSRYAFKVAALASRGVTDSAEYTNAMVDDDWKWLPWKFFGVLIVHGWVIGLLARGSLELAVLGNLVSSLLIPATLMVLIKTCSLRSAINPFELLGTMTDIGKSYLLLCLFLFLLMQGMPMAMQLLFPIVPKALLAPVMGFVVIYFVWVMAAMIGYVMYQHHGALDIEPVQAPSDAKQVAPVDPAVQMARQRDAEVARLVQDNAMNEAVTEAREWARQGYDNLDDQRRYHRVLKLADEPARMAQHAQDFVPLLLKKQRASEALEVWMSCRKRQAAFALTSPESTLALARQAWKTQQAKLVLVLLQGFEKAFPKHEKTAEVLELIVRALKQGLNESEQAVRVFMRMQALCPDHPSTQEAAWVLRDELGTPQQIA